MKLKKILLVLLMVIVLSSTIAFATEADDALDGTSDVTENVPVTTSLDYDYIDSDVELIENDYFGCEENLELSNLNVDGNIFLIGKVIELSNVHTTGSIFVVSETLNISDVNVEGSLYVVAEKLTTERTNFKNIYSVSRDAKLVAGTFIEKNFYSVSENCMYNAVSNNDVGILGSNINLGTEAIVAGNLEISSSTEPEIPNSASIGNYNFSLIEEDEKENNDSFSLSSTILKVVAFAVSTSVIALLIFKCMPNFKGKAENYELKNIVFNGLWGILLVIGLPIISIMLIATVVGIRLGIVLLLLYIISLMIATPIACILIGLLIAKKQNKTEEKMVILYIAIVSLIVAILELIPTLSGIVMILLGLVGYGTIFILPFSKKLEIKEETK